MFSNGLRSHGIIEESEEIRMDKESIPYQDFMDLDYPQRQILISRHMINAASPLDSKAKQANKAKAPGQTKPSGRSKSPDDAVVETEDNRLGHIKGGAEIEYAPEFYEAKDDMGKVSKVIITEEEATLKSGIMTWCGTTLEKLCQTARVTEDKAKGIRTVKIGGIGNATGKKYLLRFVHKDTQDGNIRVTIVGNNQAGFTIAFAKDSETVIDAEFKAQPMDKEGTLILYTEDIDKTE